MHRLSHIQIKNFRACRNVSLPLEGYTPLVGQNNAGKSSIIDAIGWVLKPSALSKNDFFDPEAPVEVMARIDGIDDDVLGRIAEDRHRNAIAPYCRDGYLWIRVVATRPAANAITKEVWDQEHCPDDEPPEAWRDYPTGLPQAVSALMPQPLIVRAMHDLSEDLGKAKAGSTIKGLLDEIMAPLLQAHAELHDALERIRQTLTTDGEHRSEHLRQFDTDATSTLAQFFPGLALDLDLQVMGVKEFFKAGDLHVTDEDTGDRRRFDQIGTGAQRAIQMALIRYLADTRATEGSRPGRRLLLIDEPELYLHPQGVRRLRHALSNLAEAGFQVVFSTHSPMMLSRQNAADTVIVSKTRDAGVITNMPLRHAVHQAIENAKSQSQTLFELGNIAEIYFASKVVLCEGKTDQRLLTLAYEQYFHRPPDLDQITFISMGSSTSIPRAMSVLATMGVRTLAVVDLDFGYTGARSSRLLPRDGEDLSHVKTVLQRLRDEHGFSLGGNGLPQADSTKSWDAADAWALFAADEEGRALAGDVQQALKGLGIWAWQEGCIEQVTNTDKKGEDAIIEQEQRLSEMSADEIEQQMPAFKACFDWIRRL